jgi:hypothetical protein
VLVKDLLVQPLGRLLVLAYAGKLLVGVAPAGMAEELPCPKTQDGSPVAKEFMADPTDKAGFLAHFSAIAARAAGNSAVVNIQYQGVVPGGFSDGKAGQIQDNILAGHL